MANETNDAAKLLTKLGRQVRKGLTRLHPVSEKHLAAVRSAVSQQWQQEQAGKAPAKRQAKPRQITRQQAGHAKSASKTKSKSHDHGHSH